MQVSAHVEQPRRGWFRFMAEPETMALLRWQPMQWSQATAAVMVALHPAHAAGQPLQQRFHPLMQFGRHAAGVVNQIPQDQQLLGLMALHQLFDSRQVGGIPITG